MYRESVGTWKVFPGRPSFCTTTNPRGVDAFYSRARHSRSDTSSSRRQSTTPTRVPVGTFPPRDPFSTTSPFSNKLFSKLSHAFAVVPPPAQTAVSQAEARTQPVGGAYRVAVASPSAMDPFGYAPPGAVWADEDPRAHRRQVPAPRGPALGPGCLPVDSEPHNALTGHHLARYSTQQQTSSQHPDDIPAEYYDFGATGGTDLSGADIPRGGYQSSYQVSKQRRLSSFRSFSANVAYVSRVACCPCCPRLLRHGGRPSRAPRT